MRQTTYCGARVGWLAGWAAALLGLVALSGRGEQPEVALNENDFKKLDTFEGVVLGKADKAFAAKEYRRAAADYDSFVLQYPRSAATAYALLRKGRCLQLDNKRHDAIKVYNEIMDYFPNAVDYAGAALFFIGECHWQNGDPAEAMKAWAEQAQDVDYRKHPLAAGAINQLADNLARQDKWNEATEYYKQVAIDFHESHRDAALYAINKVLDIYVRGAPNEPKLREFYEKARGFDHHPHATDESDYWWKLIGAIDARGQFNEADRANRENYYRYWAKAMEGKHAKWDDFQIAQARYQLASDGDQAKWMARLDRQFAENQKDGDYGRIVKWIAVYARHKSKLDEYYAKLSFDKMNNGQILDVIRTLYERTDDRAVARNAITRLKADKVSDDQREQLANWIGRRDEEGVRMVFASMVDPARGNMGMVRYYHGTRQPERGLKIVGEAVNVPQYAKEAYYKKGEFHQWSRQWPEAIAAFKQSDSPPQSTFRIAECLLADGKRDQAVANLREIENFFPGDAPEAAMRIAFAYRDTGDQKLYISSLRGVLKKYPASGQSSAAHQELERMGVKIGGGVDAE